METARLLLRQWREDDSACFAQLNADPDVMNFCPAVLSTVESNSHMQRLRARITEKGWGLWALELKATGEVIGFTGLSENVATGHVPHSRTLHMASVGYNT